MRKYSSLCLPPSPRSPAPIPPHLQIWFAAPALIKIHPLKFLMSIFKWQVNSVSNFASFFILITHNSPLSFKLTHFLLCIKGSNESPNFENFMCSGENLANSSCHFQTTSQFFFKFCTTLHHSSVSPLFSVITPLYFL